MRDFLFNDDELFMMYMGLCHMERNVLEYIEFAKDDEEVECIKNDIKKIKDLRLKVSRVSKEL